MQTTVFFPLLLAAALATTDGSGGTEGTDIDTVQYPLCGGSHQSPVDIPLASTVSKPELCNFEFHGYRQIPDSVSMKLINKEHTVQVTLLNNNDLVAITAGGLLKRYILEQFHFHWGTVDTVGSEHTVDGHAYPMEMHLVHYSSDYGSVAEAADKTEGLAVLGVFIEIGDEDNEAFDIITENMAQIPDNGDEIQPLEKFSLMDSLIPCEKEKYYRYSGSLTTAPCYESVIWTVFKKPITISQTQMDAFRALAQSNAHMQNNFRPTKPLNDRTVYRSFDDLTSKVSELEAIVATLQAATDDLLSKVSALETKEAAIGATYIRWGRKVCGSADARLVYEGRVGGALFNTGGSGGNFLCLHNEPQWGTVKPGHQGNMGAIWGASYGLVTGAESTEVFSYANNGGNTLIAKPAPCAVCDVPGRTRSIMIPARKDCPSGWTKEYSGYLAGELEGADRRRSTTICVDEAPEVTTGTLDRYEAVLHPVEARCGTLPCTTYTDGKELICVVCSK